jgi:hypothetical protein
MGLEYLETVRVFIRTNLASRVYPKVVLSGLRDSTSVCETRMTRVLLSLAGPPATLPSPHFSNAFTPIE